MALKLKAGTGVFSISATTGKLSCACCCTPTCPAPTIQWKSRSASLSKCGYTNPSGDPNKRYLSKTYCSGNNLTTGTYTAPGCTSSSSGSCDRECLSAFTSGGTRYSTKTQTLSYSNSWRVSSCPGGSNNDFSVNENLTITEVYSCSGYSITSSGISTYSRTSSNCSGGGSVTETCIETADGAGGFTKTGSGCYIFGSRYGTWVTTYSDPLPAHTDTYSSEYTTAALLTNTAAALSAYTSTWTGTAGSYYNLTTDELTNSIRQAKYRFQFTVPEACGAAMCYKIDWMEGGTAKSYTYTGTDPAGTVLYTGEYEIPIPITNSTVTVTGITATCTGC